MEDAQREYPIEFAGGVRFTAERRAKDPDGFQAALRKAHGAQEGAVCCCSGAGLRRLYISRHGEQFRIARFPNSGLEHATDCRLFEMPPEASGVGGYEKGVVSEGQDGSTCIKLRVPLSRPASVPEGAAGESAIQDRTEPAEATGGNAEEAPAEDAPAVADSADPQGEGGETGAADAIPAKRAMAELGLLHLLWTHTRLNRWHPEMEGKRSWSLVGWLVGRTAQQMKAGRTWLNGVLVVVPPAAPERRERVRGNIHSALKRIVDRAERDRVPRALVLTEVASLQRAGENGVVHLVHGEHHDVQLVSTRLQLMHLERRFPDAKAVLAQRNVGVGPSNTRVIGLFAVEPELTPDGWLLTYVSGALMLATWEFLPFGSTYEREVLDLLVDSRRAFERPMRFEAGNNIVVPDFVLCDTPVAVPMEIYGKQDPNLVARQEMRNSLYPRLFGQAQPWEWVIDVSAEPPALPGTPGKSTEAQPDSHEQTAADHQSEGDSSAASSEP